MDLAPEDQVDLPIADAAWDVQQIEPSSAIGGEFEISLGETFTDPASRAAFARREYTEILRTYRLREVTLDASLMLLLKGRVRIPETRYMVSDEDYAATLMKPLAAAPLDPTEYYVIGCNRVWHNYYHWLVQAIPAIDWALRQRGRHRVTLVLPPLHTWQEQLLTLLGYQDVPRLTLDASGTYLLPEAEFSDFLGARMPGIVSRTATATFRRLAATAPWLPGAADEIYVARTDSRNRIALNEADLIAFLERQGVRIVVPGVLPVAEQIAAFRAARLVIGPHGSGMSNVAFCQPRNFVYELLPENYPNPRINLIAQSVGLNYFADLFESHGQGNVHQDAWRIDLDVVAARLETIRARIVAVPRSESAIDFLKRTQTKQPDETVPPAPTPQAQVAARETEPPNGLLAQCLRALTRSFSLGRGG